MISDFATAPRDGTPFHILNTLRFNPLMERWEALSHHESQPERRVWRPISFACCEPSVWLRLVPLPYEVPDDQWFPVAYTATYMVRRKTRLERTRDSIVRLLRRVVAKLMPGGQDAVHLSWKQSAAKWEVVPASAMSAGTAETPQAAQGEARQRDGEAGTPNPDIARALATSQEGEKG